MTYGKWRKNNRGSYKDLNFSRIGGRFECAYALHATSDTSTKQGVAPDTMRLQNTLVVLSIPTFGTVARAASSILRERVYRPREQPEQYRRHTPSSASFFDLKVGAGQNALDSTTPAIRCRGGSCDTNSSRGERWHTSVRGSLSRVFAKSSRGGAKGWGQLIRWSPANVSSAMTNLRIRGKRLEISPRLFPCNVWFSVQHLIWVGVSFVFRRGILLSTF